MPSRRCERSRRRGRWRERRAEGVESVMRSAVAMDSEHVRLVMKDVAELREMNYQLREVGVR